MKQPISKEELAKIVELLQQGYQQAGKQIETMVLLNGEDTEILVDNRDPEKLN